ncbi:MAG: hypothetical protein AAGF47_08195 [Planctomycetota bacterium]
MSDRPHETGMHADRHEPALDPSVAFRLTADDLLGDLLWPKLLRVPGLTLRPGRIGLGVVAVLIVSLVDHLLAMASGGEALQSTIADGASMLLETGEWPTEGAAVGRWRLWVVGLLTLVVVSFVSLAVGRMAAEEFARGRFPSWTEGLAWAVRYAGAAVLAHAIPLLVAGLLIGVLAVGGLALLSVPGVNILGAVLGVVGVGLGAAVVLLLVIYTAGCGMLAPAIAVEGVDGIDAMQRIFAYLIGQPLRWLLWTVLLLVQAAIVLGLLSIFAQLTAGATSWGAGLLIGGNADLVAQGLPEDGLTAPGAIAARIMATVLQLPLLLVAGYGVAYFASGWTVQYLLLRRANDGQDVTDIYVPGEVERRVDEVMLRRSASQAEPAAGEDPTP